MAKFGKCVAVILLAGLVAACGDKDAEAPDPCAPADAKNRALAGAFIRQPEGAANLEIVPQTGKLRRNGSLSRLYFDKFTFRAKTDAETGGYRAGRGSTAVPVKGLSDKVDGVFALDVTYYQRGKKGFSGPLVVGEPTPATRLPTSGQTVFSGPVALVVQDRAAGGGPLKLTGTASMTAKYGSGAVDMRVSALSGPGAAGLPFRQLSWTGIRICSARIGSSGAGGFELLDGNLVPVNFAGASEASPTGSAVFDGYFYGGPGSSGQPAAIGGGFLIQGDSGLVSGVLVAASPG